MRYASALALVVLCAAAPVSALVASSDFVSIVQRHRPEMTRCYRASPEHAESRVVRLALHLDIAPDGHVVSASVSPSEGAGFGLRDCLESAARTWTFPPGRDANVAITFPLVLTP